MPTLSRFFLSPRALVLIGALGLAGCAGTPTPSGPGLAPGLVAEIVTPGAQMDRQAALSIVNQYRAVAGAPALTLDGGLNGQAEALATQYARTSTPPARPAAAPGMLLSAGYTTFADTFSGWRASPSDAGVMALAGARRVGFAAAYDLDSAYGTHWVMVLGQ